MLSPISIHDFCNKSTPTANSHKSHCTKLLRYPGKLNARISNVKPATGQNQLAPHPVTQWCVI